MHNIIYHQNGIWTTDDFQNPMEKATPVHECCVLHPWFQLGCHAFTFCVLYEIS